MDLTSAQVLAVLARLGIEGRRRGHRLWSKCPNPSAHRRGEDHHPSWMIRVDGPDIGLHHCFSCKFSGDAYNLVMHARGCGFPEAREWVEHATQGIRAEAATGIRWEVLPLYRLGFRLPAEVRMGSLEGWVTPARQYVAARGITPEQVDRYGLGYAVDGRLEGRVVFPFRDASGRAANYTGRTYCRGEEGKRYLNAETRERPDLGVLFGEHLWAPSPRRYAVVVAEGAVNALAIERALAFAEGVDPDPPTDTDVAALGGSDVNEVHYMKLAGFKRVVVMTDSDPAGDRCAESLAQGLGRHVEVARVRLPELDASGRKADAADFPASDLWEHMRHAWRVVE